MTKTHRLVEIIRTASKLKHSRRRRATRSNVSLQQEKRSPGLRSQRKVLENSSTHLEYRSSNVLCNPTSTDPDVGILSCGEGRFCQSTASSSIGGLCTPTGSIGISSKKDQSTTTQEGKRPIVPRRILPLIGGIEEAVSNDSEELEDDDSSSVLGVDLKDDNRISDLGGHSCVHHGSVSSRHLLHVDAGLMVCDPSSPYSDICDCSGVDTTSGTGTIYCHYTATTDAGCGSYIFDSTYFYTFESNMMTEIKVCEEATGLYNQKVCITAASADTCIFSLNDQVCSSCVVTEEFYDFDCTNVDGGMLGSAPEDRFPILRDCYESYEGTSTCTTLCQEGFYIPDGMYGVYVTVPDYGSVSCADIATAANLRIIPETYCPQFTEAARSGCCIHINPNPDKVPSNSEIWESSASPYEETNQSAISIKGILGVASIGLLAILTLAKWWTASDDSSPSNEHTTMASSSIPPTPSFSAPQSTPH